MEGSCCLAKAVFGLHVEARANTTVPGLALHSAQRACIKKNRGHRHSVWEIICLDAFTILYYKTKFMYLFVCTFSPSSVLLTNRLTQALKIRIDYSVNFSWSSEHIFNFLRFVIQKSRVFKD